jgi:histidine triad (HIT) family protein
MSCLFCSIINKEKSAFIIYEDDAVVSVLDVFPHAPGHTLVLPKRHIETVLDMKPEEMQAFWTGVNNTIQLLKKTLEPHGFTIGINHGKVSGQAVEHLHIHILPRYEGDGGGSMHSVIKNPGLKTPAQVYEMIQLSS